MSNIFENAAMTALDYSTFDLGHEVKGTGKMGKLIPVMCEEVLPGDVFSSKTSSIVRFQPLIAPLMHRVNVKFHSYYVPNRLVWNEFNDFIRGGNDGNTDYAHPVINLSNLASNNLMGKGTLYDYFGLPVIGSNITPDPIYINALPFRCVQLIWNEFFRDQNLQDRIDFSLASGIVSQAEATKIMTIRDVAWEKDYFTSCLPFAQKGTEVTIPLLGSAQATLEDPLVVYNADNGFQRFVQEDGTPEPNGSNLDVVGYAGSSEEYIGLTNGSQTDQVNIDPNGTMIMASDRASVDLASASGISINDFREAVQTQKLFEKQARGGNRIQEWIWNIFGVKTSDQRLYLPEFLGGGIQPVQISEVMQMSQTEETPQGNLAGKGFSAGQTNGFSRRFEEHGWVITLMWITPKTAYQEGIQRKFTRSDRFDYFTPDFQHLGEQEVKSQELYFDPNNPTYNNSTLGYQGRYNEYRVGVSRVCGDFRDNMAFWHMGRIFNPDNTQVLQNPPVLNGNFITCNPRKDPFAVIDESTDEIQFMLYHDLTAKRKMAYHPIPGVHVV